MCLLLDTDASHLLKIRHPQKHPSDPVLHERGHPVVDRLLSYVLHLGLALDEVGTDDSASRVAAAFAEEAATVGRHAAGVLREDGGRLFRANGEVSRGVDVPTAQGSLDFAANVIAHDQSAECGRIGRRESQIEAGDEAVRIERADRGPAAGPHQTMDSGQLAGHLSGSSSLRLGRDGGSGP